METTTEISVVIFLQIMSHCLAFHEAADGNVLSSFSLSKEHFLLKGHQTGADFRLYLPPSWHQRCSTQGHSFNCYTNR